MSTSDNKKKQKNYLLFKNSCGNATNSLLHLLFDARITPTEICKQLSHTYDSQGLQFAVGCLVCCFTVTMLRKSHHTVQIQSYAAANSRKTFHCSLFVLSTDTLAPLDKKN
jgi:hypothetical protein